MKHFEIRVVLVRSLYESNIGATSRAMANMGAEKLILIAPQCELTFKAQQAAATGQHALQNHVKYSSWKEFYKNEPEGLRISFTARDGRGRKVKDFSETLKLIEEQHPEISKKSEKPTILYLIFGPEDWGLSAEDLELTNFACSIPTFGDNTSLNLAQAVLLGLYTLRINWGGKKAKLVGQQSPRTQSAQHVFPEESLKMWLTEMGFNISSRKMNVYTVLRRMLLQNTPNRKELNLLEIVLQQSTRKLRAYNVLRKKYRDNGEGSEEKS